MIQAPKELQIRATRGFGIAGKPVAIGDVLTVDYAFARELIANNKAERYEAPADEPAAPSGDEAPKPRGRRAAKE